ncbi:MAG: hypothetical protein F6K54_01510 [Okeania sp. SIO3B5]|uniref:hypothetical protein n=1 Tax=Okeania sp. SIO3B5 TaxID=2607811 RepID=UPI001401884C|nr:hypothetical protein [Okeania sp. SIO3B5]NEO51879.1 hypothetical protein [Okeania sp. SIO3B5]
MLPLPTFEKIETAQQTPGWVQYIEECRQHWGMVSRVTSEQAQVLHEELSRTTYSYIERGILLKAVVTTKSYKQLGFDNFADYCHRHFKHSDGYARRIMRAARVAIDLIRCGFEVLPTCIAQADIVGKGYQGFTKKQAEDAREWLAYRWQACLARAEGDKCPITHSFIVKVLEPQDHSHRTVKVNKETWEQLEELAAAEDYYSFAKDRKTTPEECLTTLVRKEYSEGAAYKPKVELDKNVWGKASDLARLFQLTASQTFTWMIEEAHDRFFRKQKSDNNTTNGDSPDESLDQDKQESTPNEEPNNGTTTDSQTVPVAFGKALVQVLETENPDKRPKWSNDNDAHYSSGDGNDDSDNDNGNMLDYY